MRLRFFKSKERRQCLAELDRSLQSNDLLSKVSISADVRQLLKSKWAVEGIRVAKKSPKVIVALAINRVSAEKLQKGGSDLFAYRGFLTQPGQDMLQVYDYSVDALVQEGELEETEGADDKAWLREEIRGVG